MAEPEHPGASDPGAPENRAAPGAPAAPPDDPPGDGDLDPVTVAVRDIADVPAAEVITTAAVHLMSAAAVACGLSPDTRSQKGSELRDLDEARRLITALAGLVTAAAPEIGNQHARALRDGLRSLQLAFREASLIPDPPGEGPGETWTGPVH